ncbi:MAG TPA: CSLREA domain-containing protein, partial [Rhodothermales bacterium]|nr:CSLREA domain-containing protein [Rhodothermales bacterium]
LADADGEEGQMLLGSDTYTASDYSFPPTTSTFTPAVAVAAGHRIVATVTDKDGNTSEFSASILVDDLVDDLVVNATDDDSDSNAGDGVCFTGQFNSTGNGECTLRAAIEEANALAGVDSILFSIPTGDAGCTGNTCVITPATALPDIEESLTIDGTTQPGATCSGWALKIVLDGATTTDSYGLRLQYGTDFSTIRGLALHSFDSYGLFIRSESNHIACNIIGTDPSWSTSLGNGGPGIRITGASSKPAGSNIIGTDGDGVEDDMEGNVILNNAIGIEITGSWTGDNQIGGNLIGVVPDGMTPLGNVAQGIRISSAPGNTIGGTLPARMNTIAYNGEAGVQISNPPATQNNVQRNRIYNNVSIGIDLVKNAEVGVTPNDPEDPDFGPNRLQNYPDLISAVREGGTTTIIYALDSAPGNTTYPVRIDFYLADEDGEEGQTWLAATQYSRSDYEGCGAPPCSKSATLTGVAAVGQIVATTNTGTNTSEFSPAITVAGAVAHVVDSTGDEVDAMPGDGFCQTAADTCTLRAAIQEANAFTGADSIHFDIPASDPGCTGGVCTIEPTETLPDIDETVILDATTQPGTDCAWDSRALRVVLDGTNIGGARGLTFEAGSNNSAVRGLAIHGFNTSGISVRSDANTFQCNNLGSDATGTVAVGISLYGFALNTVTGTLIGTDGDGTDDALEGNLVVGAIAVGGVVLTRSTNTIIAGNRIGTNAAGTAQLSSQNVGIDLNADNNTDNRIGTNGDGVSDAEEANIIAFNGGDGILIGGNGTLRNAVLGNRMFENNEQGIDLLGVGANDADDADEGINRGQNKPDIAWVLLAGNDLTVRYLINTAPANATYPLRVEFFLADADEQEGETFLGFLTYEEADAQQQVTATFTPAVPVSEGDV